MARTGRPSLGRDHAMLTGSLRRFERREAAKAAAAAAIAATPMPDWIADAPATLGPDGVDAWRTLATAYTASELHTLGRFGLQRLAEARGTEVGALRAVTRIPPICDTRERDRLHRSHMSAVRAFGTLERRLLASAAPRSAPAGSPPPPPPPERTTGPRAWDGWDRLAAFSIIAGRSDPRLPAYRFSQAEVARIVAERVAAGLPPMARGQDGPGRPRADQGGRGAPGP